MALLVSCTDSNQHNYTNTEYDEANQRISRGQYSTAIAMMGSKLDRDPQDRDARLILASAYAARAGIFMSEYIDISRRIVAKIRETEVFLDSSAVNMFDRAESKTKDRSQRDLLSLLEHVYRATYQVHQLISIFALLPPLTEPNRRDLEQAVRLLSAEKQYKGGALLYRGILRLALLKNDMKTKYDMTHLRSCTLDLRKLNQQLSSLSREVGLILNDFFMGSLPKSKAEALDQAADKIDREFVNALDDLAAFGFDENVDVTDVTKKLGGNCQK